MPKKLKISLLLLTLALPWGAHAQIGISAGLIKPSLQYGFVFKPTTGLELSFANGDIDSRFKTKLSLGYYSLTPRFDTLHNGGLFHQYNTTTFTPGTEIWKSFKAITVGFQFEFKVLDKPLSPTLGLDVVYQANSYKYEIHNKIEDGNYEMSSNAIGLTPRIGFSYELNDAWLISGMVGKNLVMDWELAGYSYWKSMVGVTYYFN
ncbi:MAG: hypothetical protein K1X81_06985 [Bacteroidia bacterium]|nr:hypothetical protein [Bacteroidia bacterium]